MGPTCISARTQWQSRRIGQDYDLGAFAAFGLADTFAPFFAEANVPSARLPEG
jgi:hypothetical protein